MHNSQDYLEQRKLNKTPEENWKIISNFLTSKVKNLKNHQIKKILLVNPPQIQTQTLDLETFKNKRYFNYPPYGIGLLKSCINKKNPEINVEILDLNYEVLKFVDIFLKSKQENNNFSKEDILNIKNYNFVNYFDQMFEGQVSNLEGLDIEKIMRPIYKDLLKKYDPDLVGISCMFTMSHKRMLSLAKITKELSNQTIVFAGGVHPTSSSEKILRETSNIDFVSLFEADESIPQLISFLNNHNSNIESLRQTAIFFNGKYYETQNRLHPAGESLDLRPDYGSINVSDYSDLGEIGAYRFWWNENTKAGTILSNRGCRARCSFCSVRNFNGKGVRGRSYNSVVDEMQFNKEHFGINHFMWLDDDLLFNKERTISMFNEIVKRNLNITWDASNGIIASALKDEILDAAAASGCIGMHFGIESGNDEILKQVHKPSGKKHYLALEEKLKKYPQIFTKGFLMVGFPNETLAQMLETVEMAVKINLDWYTIQVVHPLPKTEMHQQLVDMGLLSDDEIEDEKLNYGNRSGKRKKIENSYEEIDFNDPFQSNLQRVPSKEEMEDIWFTSDFKINYERINKIKDIDKLKKLSVFLKFISKKISVKNPLVDYYTSLVNNKITNKKNKISVDKKNQSIFWQKRLNVLMKDTYDLL